MAILAIEGHPKRGNEVIGILEMLGGKNPSNFNGASSMYYLIGSIEPKILCTIKTELDNSYEQFTYFTLEEFLEKFPYKVGDKVKIWINGYHSICNIQNMQWDSLINEIKYKIQDYWYSVMHLQPYEEENYCQVIGIGNDTSSNRINTSASLINEETMEERKYSELRMPLDDDDKLATEITISGNKIVPPDGYLIGKITQVDNGMIVEYVKKQPQYPKTYEECFNICFGNKHHIVQVVGLDDLGDNKELFESFIKLKICRDAYWKIVGDWEPEFRFGKKKYCIMTKDNKVISATVEETNRILVFPTEEMRDAFYENFKELIENCKELL